MHLGLLVGAAKRASSPLWSDSGLNCRPSDTYVDRSIRLPILVEYGLGPSSVDSTVDIGVFDTDSDWMAPEAATRSARGLLTG